MSSILVTPKNAEELDFLVTLLNKMGISTQIFTEAEKATFSQSHELAETGPIFLEERAPSSQESSATFKTWNLVKGEA